MQPSKLPSGWFLWLWPVGAVMWFGIWVAVKWML